MLDLMEPAILSLKNLTADVGHIGVVSLLVLHLADPRHVREDELMVIAKVDSLSTLRNWLSKCELLQYVSRLKKNTKDKFQWWHITDIGKNALSCALSMLGLPGTSTGGLLPAATADSQTSAVTEKNFFSLPSSSSSDQIIDQNSNQDSDLIESEEEENEADFKKFLCQQYGFTGPKAAALIDDSRVTPELICGWMAAVTRLKREKFHFRKTPESYALGCLLKPEGQDVDLPPQEDLHNSTFALELYWRQFSALQDAHAAH